MNVAVVIPTHDRAEMVVQAVESALEQTVACRVIVVDDGSTDDTLDRLRTFGDEITVLARANEERGAARNAGAAAASGADLLCFLDSDDLLDPDHARTVAELARGRPEASLVAVRAALVDRTLEPVDRLGASPPGPVGLESFLLGRQALPPSAVAVRAVVFRRVGGFDERRVLAGSEDWLFTARALTLSPGFRGEASTVRLRRHGANTMSDPEGMLRTMLLAHRAYFDEPVAGLGDRATAEEPFPGIRERSRARLILNAATQFYARGRMARARNLLAEAARTDPGVVLEPKWGWTGLRSLLGARLSRRLRRLKRRLGSRGRR
ncbi:MAG: glycosyltransferase [Gemmatimonadetes bacterium]|nr:glycosyltransferase family 2 protein [Gemmatimonadota bacterium]NIR78976.1 glycosyltransferase family 2 protein [Gemmatimonadota bacterium]NIT87625.1 glycosyltransferase family 2 protein [Gemmatimonadota bacterium]NIU31487.1 glycosyltransferase family 2 protein [Gemmatimonadota bacterium]NIU36154.1 glycosyltransferase [Gemmatimonadota bacterium]